MQDVALSRRSGLQTALDVIVAPKAAFAQLREVPTWGWAFLISTVLGMIAAFAVGPAVAHALSAELPAKLAASPQIAQLPAAQRDAMIAQQVGIAQTITKFSFIFIPIGLAIGSALQALFMLAANAVGKGDGTFKKFWALAVNAGIVGTGISSIVLMLIVLIRGADSFTAASDVSGALPGLGTLVPPGAKAVAAFFSVMHIFAIWNMVLLVVGMGIVARIPRGAAIVTAIVMLLGTGLFPLVGAITQK
ncbi:MAG: hypothetical protein NVS2B17_03770 [Candidatus Velthaea sp.]